MTMLTEQSRNEVAVLGMLAARNAHEIRKCMRGYRRVPNLVAEAYNTAVLVTLEAAEMLAPTYTIGQAARFVNRALKPLWQAHELACNADAAVDGGEWSWRATERAEAALDAAAERLLRRLGYTMAELEAYDREMEYRHGTGWYDPPMADRHEDLGDHCTNWKMHAKYADRGIEDQCPHCVIKHNLDRIGDVL